MMHISATEPYQHCQSTVSRRRWIPVRTGIATRLEIVIFLASLVDRLKIQPLYVRLWKSAVC
jgi:hypothetical protein